MGLMDKAKATAAGQMEQRREAKVVQEAAQAAAQAIQSQHLAALPKWEYQVKRIGADKQRGLLGSERMEQIFDGEGARGWELVTINDERATFKRRRPG